MDELKSIIAKNIADLRKANNLTQAELAEKLNYSDKAVSKWERGESLPDIAVLKSIADIFGVTVDYLVTEDHTEPESTPASEKKTRVYNRGFITGISMILVWLAAITVFVFIDYIAPAMVRHYLVFVFAVPATMIVWLVLNSVWFSKRRNFLIISLLLWSTLGAFYVTLLPEFNIWKIFLMGAPAQIIILLWSGLKYKKPGVKKPKVKKEKVKKEKKNKE